MKARKLEDSIWLIVISTPTIPEHQDPSQTISYPAIMTASASQTAQTGSKQKLIVDGLLFGDEPCFLTTRQTCLADARALPPTLPHQTWTAPSSTLHPVCWPHGRSTVVNTAWICRRSCGQVTVSGQRTSESTVSVHLAV